MERNGSPIFARQRSNDSNNSSPSMSPAHPSHHVRSGSLGGVRRTQNYAAKAAAARLATLMQASQSPDDDDDDDMQFHNSQSYAQTNNFARAQSPRLVRTGDESGTDQLRSASAGRIVRSTPLVPPTSATARIKPPSIASQPPRVAEPPLDSIADFRRDRRPSELVHHQRQDSGTSKREAAALRDEIDLLQEENAVVLEKLRLAEDKLQASDARSKELEKQVASLGEGISLEARLLHRKEAALKQREAALKAAKQTRDVKDDEIAALRLEAESARDEAVSASQQAREAEAEAKALRTMTNRMILTQEEMEEVVLKRCWLARYWGLAVRHGVHPEIAPVKYEHWSSLAPLPLEVVLSAGQKANEEYAVANGDGKRASRDVNDITGEGNIESMLSVEKGLRELASLKVEDGVLLAMAEHRRPSLLRVGQGFPDARGSDGPRLVESMDLSSEEVEDVQFKQAWLAYFWRRAKNNNIEADIADERLQYWISRSSVTPTFHDAVDVERGLMELRKLGIEDELWEASRKEIAQDIQKGSSSGD